VRSYVYSFPFQLLHILKFELQISSCVAVRRAATLKHLVHFPSKIDAHSCCRPKGFSGIVNDVCESYALLIPTR